MSKKEIHPDFVDLEIEKAKTYLTNTSAVTIIDDEENEVMMVLHGEVIIDDTDQFEIGDIVISSAIGKSSHQNTRFITKSNQYFVCDEPADFISLTVAEWLFMSSMKDNPMNIVLNRYLKNSNF